MMLSRRRASLALPLDEEHVDQQQVLRNNNQQQHHARSACRKRKQRAAAKLVCGCVLILLLSQYIDYQAILERPKDIITMMQQQQNQQSHTMKNRNSTILILMIETRDTLPNTVCVNRHYATSQQYDFRVIQHHACFDQYKHRFGNLAYLWCRPLVFMQVLHDYDAMLYLDSDAYFCNPTMSIDDFFEYCRQHDYYTTPRKGDTTFVGATDCGNYMSNGGIQYWKRSELTNEILATWFLYYRVQYPFFWIRNVPSMAQYIPRHWIVDNREQGTFKIMMGLHKFWRQNEMSLIRYGKETWHLPYSNPECLWVFNWTQDTYFLNHIPGNIDADFRNGWVEKHIQRHKIECG